MSATLTPARRGVTATALAVLTVAALLATQPSDAAVSGRELRLTFDHTDLLHNSGTARLSVREVSDNQGTIGTVTSWDGTGSAARFPRFELDTPPQAVVTVRDKRGRDDLDPGTADFRFGAEFALDNESWGSSSDNGDNLVQRGLYDDKTQYKLQVDGARPYCRVKGRDGSVTVHSTVTVVPRVWYAAQCTRKGTDLVLVVTRLDDGSRSVYQASGVTGSMRPASSSVPLSVGGKVTSNGALVSDDADQFNGRVDDVVLNVS
jgi:hypothetical protein